MKIYRFNPVTGIYLGEDFADEMPMRRGLFIVPADATTIAPPSVEKGQVLIFRFVEQRWEATIPQSHTSFLNQTLHVVKFHYTDLDFPMERVSHEHV